MVVYCLVIVADFAGIYKCSGVCLIFKIILICGKACQKNQSKASVILRRAHPQNNKIIIPTIMLLKMSYGFLESALWFF